jgi:hypothetical protein
MPETDIIDSKVALELAARFLPNLAESLIAIAAPGEGEGFWAGASSAVEYGGEVFMAYRLRKPLGEGRGYGNVIACSPDGENFKTILTISKEEMDAESLERPALVRTHEGKWRLYVSCSTHGTKHWRVEMLEADHPSKFDTSKRQVVLPGDKHTGVKDPVITWRNNLWHLWASCHPLDVAEQEDRMVSNYATSSDGINWTWQGTALRGRPGLWDSRGTRISSVQFESNIVLAFYDGRASEDENYEERTGVAIGSKPSALTAYGNEPLAQSANNKGLRYLDVIELASGGKRLYYELTRPDGAHELRTEVRR